MSEFQENPQAQHQEKGCFLCPLPPAFMRPGSPEAQGAGGVAGGARRIFFQVTRSRDRGVQSPEFD